MDRGLEQFQLDNGLTVILAPHRLAPVVALQAWVGTGSVDEPPGQAGIAHVFEHMLFKGTRRRGIGQIAQEVEAAGGEINAWTSFHHTVFHVVLASRYLETGLDVLADALQNSAFDPGEIEREREVVIEEILQSRDNPARNVAQVLLSTAFERHPYGRPIIGDDASVRALTRKHLLSFFERWYVANNITLVVAGDFEVPRVRRVIRNALGAMRSRPLVRRRHAEPTQTAMRARVTTHEVRESYLAMGFPIPPVRDPALAAIDVAALILGQGESSRLARSVRRERELVTSIYSHAQPLRDHGLFVVSATALPEKFLDAADAAAMEVFRLGTGEVDTSELDRAKRSIEADLVYQRETAQGVARSAGYFHALTGNAGFEAEYLDRVRRLTPGDVRAAVQAYLSPGRATMAAVVPAGAVAAAPRGRPLAAARQLMGRVRKVARQAAARPRIAQKNQPRQDSIRREVLPSGMRVVIKHDHSVPVVAMRAVWTGGLLLETGEQSGMTTLLARMLLRGCNGMSADNISARIDDMAGSLSGTAGRNTLGLRAEWLARDWEHGLELMAQCILSPDFDAHELAREKRRLLDELRAREDSPSFVAFRTFAETLYRKHPYRLDVAGTPGSVAALEQRDLVDFYGRNFPVGELTLAMVGDIDPDRAMAQVQRLFGKEARKTRPERTITREQFTGRPARSREVYRFLDREQAHLIIGFPGTTIDHPDRFPLQVLTTILGGQGGRLFVELRDRRALAYHVSAVSVEGLDPGYVAVYLACSPDKLAQAVEGIRAELGAVIEKAVSPAELDRAKRYLIGTHEIAQQRRSTVAAALAFHEAYGLGYQEYARYAAAIRAVTAADVQRVASGYLDWDLAITATVKPPDASPEAARRAKGVKKRARKQPRKRASRSQAGAGSK